jgi:hypothetical protein
MQTKRMTFSSPWLPYALLAPQVIVTLIFFIWPASQALWQSVCGRTPSASGADLRLVPQLPDALRRSALPELAEGHLHLRRRHHASVDVAWRFSSR